MTTSPSDSSLEYMHERIEELKRMLAKENVIEIEYERYMPGVIATNMGIQLPMEHGKNCPALPSNTSSMRATDDYIRDMDDKYDECNKKCTDLYLQIHSKDISLTKRKKLEKDMQSALLSAGHCKHARLAYNLNIKPRVPEEFYRKITPLFNELQNWSDRYMDAKRAAAFLNC